MARRMTAYAQREVSSRLASSSNLCLAKEKRVVENARGEHTGYCTVSVENHSIDVAQILSQVESVGVFSERTAWKGDAALAVVSAFPERPFPEAPPMGS
jgi:hypothetical protein